MNRVETLISDLCPDGVPVFPLGEIGTTVSGLRGKSKEDFSDGNAPYVSYVEIFKNPGIDFVPERRVKVGSDENQSAIQLGDVLVTGSSETRNECGMTAVVTSNPKLPIYLNSFCFIWRPNKGVELDPQFAKHLFRGRAFRDRVIETANGVTRQNISKPKFLAIEIPLPPLAVQREVASILNKFIELEAELKAELKARRTQFAFLLDEVFDSEEIRKSGLTKLDDHGEFDRGNGLQKTDFSENGIGCIHYGQIYTKFGSHADDVYTYVPKALAAKLKKVKQGNLIITTTSENIKDVCKAVAWLGESEIVIGGHSCVYRHDLDPLFATYLFRSRLFQDQKNSYVQGTKVKDIKPAQIGKIEVYVPPMKKQIEIGLMMRNFDALLQDVSIGLPAEIAARRQQYEYYRNKLLSFEPLEAA